MCNVVPSLSINAYYLLAMSDYASFQGRWPLGIGDYVGCIDSRAVCAIEQLCAGRIGADDAGEEHVAARSDQIIGYVCSAT
jgi:hypothetical protein